MASFSTTIIFIIHYLWAVAKQTLILITTSWILYLVNINEDLRGFLSANLFAINVIFIYFLFIKDKYLEISGFYLLYNISTSRVFLSKLLLLGIVFIVHFSIYFIVILRISFHLYLTLIGILFLAILCKLILFNIRGSWTIDNPRPFKTTLK